VMILMILMILSFNAGAQKKDPNLVLSKIEG